MKVFHLTLKYLFYETHCSSNPDEWLKGKLLPIAALLSFLGIVTGLAESILKFVNLAESNFYLFITILWAVFAVIFFQLDFSRLGTSSLQRKRIKIAIFALTTLIFVIGITWKYYELHIRRTGHAEHPTLQLSGLEMHPRFNAELGTNMLAISYKSFIPGRQAPFKVEEMNIDEDLCSFVETMDEYNAGLKKIRTFEYNINLNMAFSQGTCFGLYGDEPAKKVLSILRENLDKSGKSGLKNYVSSVGELSRVIKERGDIFNQIMLTSDEIGALKQTSPEKYEIVRDWILHCIGVKQPVISFVLLNSSRKDLLINKVVYDVSDIGQVKGGGSGPLYPVLTYTHDLEHKKGLQIRSLSPPLLLKANDRVAFNIRLVPTTKESGLTWVMKIRFYDSMNQTAETDPFQLIMSK